MAPKRRTPLQCPQTPPPGGATVVHRRRWPPPLASTVASKTSRKPILARLPPSPFAPSPRFVASARFNRVVVDFPREVEAAHPSQPIPVPLQGPRWSLSLQRVQGGTRSVQSGLTAVTPLESRLHRESGRYLSRRVTSPPPSPLRTPRAPGPFFGGRHPHVLAPEWLESC